MSAHDYRELRKHIASGGLLRDFPLEDCRCGVCGTGGCLMYPDPKEDNDAPPKASTLARVSSMLGTNGRILPTLCRRAEGLHTQTRLRVRGGSMTTERQPARRGPSRQNLADWERRLYLLLGEMEKSYGEDLYRIAPPKVECLTRFAWEETRVQIARLDAPAPDCCKGDA